MHWTFGTFLWSTLVVFFWVAVIWMFIAIFADILRRDMSGWAKAGWIVLIVLLPFLGMLIYVITVSATGPYAITLTMTATTAKQHSVTVLWGGPDQPDLKARILTVLIGRGAAHYDLSAPAAPAFS